MIYNLQSRYLTDLHLLDLKSCIQDNIGIRPFDRAIWAFRMCASIYVDPFEKAWATSLLVAGTARFGTFSGFLYDCISFLTLSSEGFLRRALSMRLANPGYNGGPNSSSPSKNSSHSLRRSSNLEEDDLGADAWPRSKTEPEKYKTQLESGRDMYVCMYVF